MNKPTNIFRTTAILTLCLLVFFIFNPSSILADEGTSTTETNPEDVESILPPETIVASFGGQSITLGEFNQLWEQVQKELEYQKEIGRLFSKMEEYIRNNSIEKVSIRFPRGVLRKADDFRSELYFIDDSTFKTNIAYHLMLTELYHWFLNRFDMGLTAQEMLIKAEFCLYGSICGAIAQCFDKKLLNLEQVGVKRALSALIKNGIIDEDLKKRIMKIAPDDERWSQIKD